MSPLPEVPHILTKPPLSDRMLEALITTLLSALYARDPWQATHAQRVSAIAVIFASHWGMQEQEIDSIRIGALVHDIGKIGTPDDILKKPGRLSPVEFEVIKRHPATGRAILSSIRGVPQPVLDIVHFHHERVDGRGYPEGLVANQIPLVARLVSIADAWDAMTSNRAYRAPLSWELARQELSHGAGTQFDADLTSFFLERVLPHLAKLYGSSVTD